MKKFATLLAVILMAFSVCFLTACTQPYSKIYLEVYDAQGTKLTLDEDYRFVLNDDGENDFSLNVKVRGVKKEKVTVGFTKKSSTNAFSILEYQTTGNTATVKLRGDNRGTGYLYVRVLESDKVKEIAVPIKIVKELTNLETKPDVYTAVAIGTSITLDTSMLAFTPYDTNETEVDFSLATVGAQNNFVTLNSNRLTVSGNYNIESLGKTIKVVATSKYKSSLKAEFDVYVVKSITQNDVTLSYFDYDSKTLVRGDGQTPINVGNEITLVKGAEGYKSVYVAISANSEYKFNEEVGLDVMAYLPNNKIVTVARCDLPDVEYPVYRITSELFDGSSQVSFKVSFSKFGNIASVEKTVNVRVVDMPYKLMLNGETADAFDLDLYTEYDSSVKGLALNFNVLPNNVLDEYNQTYLDVENANIAEILVLRYVDDYGVVRTLQPSQTEYVLPRNKTIYASLNPSANYSDYISTGIKLNAWCYTTIDRFGGKDVTNRAKVNVAVNLAIKQGINGIGAYKDGANSIVETVGDDFTVIANNVTSGGANRTIYLDFKPTGSVEVNKNITIQSSKPSVVKFVLGGTTYSQITGNQLIALAKNTSSSQEKTLYALTIKGFDKGEAQIIITTGNGVTKYVKVTTVAGTNSLSLTEVTSKIAYSLSATESGFYRGYSDIVVPVYSAINLKVNGSNANADITIRNARVVSDEAGLSQNEVVSLYETGSQITLTAIVEGANKVQFSVNYYDMNGIAQSWFVSFYIYVYMPVQAFELSTHSATLMYNVGYFEKTQYSQFNLGVRYNVDGATEKINLLSTNAFDAYRYETDDNNIVYFDSATNSIVLRVYTITRTLNESIFMGSLENTARMDRANLNLLLRLNELQDMPTSTNVTVNLQQFNEIVSSQRCDITIRRAVKVENIVVNNVSKKSGSYIINFDLRNGRCGTTREEIEKYLLNLDNNFKQILTSITNANEATFDQIDYKIVKYLDENGNMVSGDDSTVSIIQKSGELTVVPHKGGEVILHIFPHDRWISATEYDRNGPVIEIDIKVSDGDKVPYQIGTVSQLLAIGENEQTMSYKYELISDINLTYKGSTAVLPIGKTKNGILPFTGSLSGAYEIKKEDGSVLSVQYYLRNPEFTLENNGTESFAGLFAQNDGTLKNIYIDNARFAVYGTDGQAITLNNDTYTNYYLAGLVGKNNGQVINCYVGLAQNGVDINEIKFNVTVNKQFNIYAGGLVAYNAGSITANAMMTSGELNINITKSETQSNRTRTYLGGVVGNNIGILDGNYQSDYQRYARVFNPKLADFNNGKYYILVDGEYTQAKTNSSIYNVNATYYRLSAGVLEANKRVLSEHISSNLTINASIATDYSYIGGIAGYNNGTIGNVSYNGMIDCVTDGKKIVGRVGDTTTSYVGGLVGFNMGKGDDTQDLYNSISIGCQILTADENTNNETETRDGNDIGIIIGAGAVGGAVGGSENSNLYLIGAQFMTTTGDESYSSITANQIAGGLIGVSIRDSISYSYVESFFKQYATNDLGKKVNTLRDIVLYENADNSLTLLASGFIASAENSTIDRSYAKLNLASNNDNPSARLSGLLSYGNATISNSYFKGNLINADVDAGLIVNADASAVVASTYAKGYINAPSFDDPDLSNAYNNVVINKDGMEIADSISYVFDDEFSNSISNNDDDNDFIWYFNPSNSEYNDGDPVQWCNGVKFATLIPTSIRISINADADGALYKSQANITGNTKNLLAGYKYDDSTMVLFYRSFVAGNEYANYVRLSDLVSVFITPDQAKSDIEYKIVEGNIARINKVNGNSCVSLSTTGKFTLRVYAIYNSALYQDITVYVTNGVSEYDLYNTTDTSASQNKLADGKALSLATESSTIFASKVRFNDGNVTNNNYNINSSLYLHFDVADEIFTINEQSPNGNFKADKNLAIKTVSASAIENQDKITSVKVTPYLDLHALFADDFAEGEKIDLLPLVREFNLRVCKRARAINTNNILAIASESSKYASLNIELETDYTSSVLPTLDTLTDSRVQLNETDGLRLSISADSDSHAFVSNVMSKYGITDIMDLFDISAEILPSANGIMYNDLRVQLKEYYRELDSEVHFNLHFWADSNADVTKDIGLTITPSTITKIVMTHFAETNATQSIGGQTKQTLQSSSATNMIVPGKSGIMMITVNPIYANVDYFTIESSTNMGYAVSFEQMVKVEGKDEYVTLFPRPAMPTLAKYSTIDADGNLSYDGNLYVRTILPTIVARELNFELTVNAYLNNDPTSLKTASKTLLTAYVPDISMTVDADDAVSVYLMEHWDGKETSTDENAKTDLYIRFTDPHSDAKYIYNNEKVKDVDDDGNVTYRYETAYYVPLKDGQVVDEDLIYVRREYFLVENNTSNITINMEVVGYEFGTPTYTADWIDTPDDDGRVYAPAPTLVRSLRGVYAGSSNLTIMGNESNIGKRFKLTGKIEVLRNGIRRDAEKELRFIIVENLIRPRNVTVGNLTDDGTLSFAMGATQSLDLVWMTDAGSLNKDKQATINQALYNDIGGTGTSFSAEKLANLFYIRRNTVYGTTNDPLSLGADSSSLFRIKENYTNREFTGLTIIGTSQTNGTVLGFKVYYYYDENLELRFTTDYEGLKDKYVLTEINFEFNLLIYYTSTEQEPIPIYTASQFKSYLSATVNDINTTNTNYILMADITLEDYEPFDANFSSLDGNGKIIKIYNFTPTAPTSESTARVGLFKTVSANTLLKNLTLDVSMLKDINLVAYTGYEVGLLAVSNAGIITNCDVVALRLNAPGTVASIKTINILAQQSTTTAHFGGLVVNNSGNITNSRIGVPSFVSYIINSTDTKTETDTQTYLSNDILVTGVGDMGGFVYTNSGIISSCYVRGLNFTNNSTELDSAKTAGFVVSNSGRIYFSYVRGSGDSTAGAPRMTTTSITSNGDVAGFVSNNSGYIGDSYANIKVFSVSKFTAGFVGSNSSSIERCYSACDIESNAPRQTPFTGTNVLHELQDSSNGGIVDCYYLIMAGEYFPIEDDSAQSMSISSFQMSNTLNNFNFVNSNNIDEARAGIWIYNYNDDDAKVQEKYILPDLTSPNGIAKSLRYLNTELTDEQGNVVGYSYLYVKDYELGSQTNPYIIRYASEFNKIFADALTADDSTQIVQSLANVRFVNDIDFKDVGDEVKTRERVIFSGQIDGNGMQINGINITTNTTNKALNSLGLFSKVLKASTLDARTPIIKNITLNYTQLMGSSTAYVGGIAGIIRDAYIINVNLTGGITIQAYNYAGGLAGMITGKSLIMNVNSNLSVSVGKSNKIVDQYGHYVPNTYFSYEDYARINRNATQATYENYLSTLSYAGGLAGVIDLQLEDVETPADLTRSNVNLVKINAVADKTGVTSVGSNVSVHADVVGGIAGYAGKNTYINSTKFYLNTTSTANSVLDGYYIVGGLVGENLGKIAVSELVCDNDSQLNIDKANGAYIRGETETISGNYLGAKGSYFAGGLIGINYQGAVEHCQTHLSLYACDAQFVGGIVGGTLGGAFNTMYTASAMPVLTNENAYSGGFAGITFNAFNKGQSAGALSNSIWQYYINDYINAQTDVLTNKISVVLNRVVCAQYYDHEKLVNTSADAHNASFVGYSALPQSKAEGEEVYSYKGSQLDTLYASANNPTNCFIDGTYYYSQDKFASLKAIAKFDGESEFDTNMLDLQTMSIETLTNREAGHEADQRAEFQSVFSEWSLNYWTALDETTIYPRLLQIGFGSVIEIDSVEDLKFIEQNPSGSFVITRDINMGGAKYDNCIIKTVFTGRIIGYKEDGTAPTIYNMCMEANSNDPACLAFFHEIKNATISNIDFRYVSFDADVKGGNVAGVVALDSGGSTLSEITVGFNANPSDATLKDKNYDTNGVLVAEYANNVGGLVAESFGTNIVNCVAQMNIRSCAANLGGLVGYSHTIDNWNETGSYPPLTTIVSSCYYGTIDAKVDKDTNIKSIGGLVGQLANGAINNSRTYLLNANKEIDDTKVATICFNTRYTNNNNINVGGLVGLANADVSQKSESIGFTNCEVLINLEAVNNGSGNILHVGYVAGNARSANFTMITINNGCRLSAGNIVANNLYYGGMSGYGSNVTVSESTVLADIKLDNIKANEIYAGSVFGKLDATSSSKISGVLVKNTISTSNLTSLEETKPVKVKLGGLVGETEFGTDATELVIRTSAHYGEINIGETATGRYYVGGIIGNARGALVEGCQTGANIIVGNITGSYNIGGLIGYIQSASDVTLTRCIMLSYFKLANQLVRSNNEFTGSGVDPICMGTLSNDSVGNIYSADYSFIVARQSYTEDKTKVGVLTNMRADQLLGRLTNSRPMSIAVDLALGAINETSYVLNRADSSATGSTNNLYAMGKLPSSNQTVYVMPYLITLGERMSANKLFESGSVMKPKIITSQENQGDNYVSKQNLFVDENLIFIACENFTFETGGNILNSRIVGCGVTFELGSNFVQTIGTSGAISGVTFSAKANVNGVRVSNNGGVIANINQGVIFDCHMIDEITIDSSTMTSGTDKFGCVVGVNDGTIFGFGNGAMFTLGNGAKQFVSGIAVTNNGRIEGCYVTADLTEVALNNPNTTGLVHTNLGVIYNTYFAGALSDGGSLTDALVVNAKDERTGGEPCVATADVFTRKNASDIEVGREEMTYVDFYSNFVLDILGRTEAKTTRQLFENGGKGENSEKYPADGVLLGNIWAIQRYEGNGTVKGRFGMETNTNNNDTINNLNYGYPVIDLGTQIYSYNELELTGQWVAEINRVLVGRDTGDGSSEILKEGDTNPIQVINLGVLDYTRSLYNNSNIKEYKLTRNIVIANNSNYSLANNWSKTNDKDSDKTYYGNANFNQIFNGNDKIIYNLYGGALFESVTEKMTNGENPTRVGGIIKNVSMFNSYASTTANSTGGLINTLNSGLVEGVNVYGIIKAEASIAKTMNNGTVTNCKILVDEISGKETSAGIVNTITGGQITRCQVGSTTDDVNSKPEITGQGDGAAGLAYNASGTAVLQDNVVSGAVIKADNGISAGAIAICNSSVTDIETKYVLSSNTISATVANGKNLVAGLVGQLNGGNIVNNSTGKGGAITLQGTSANVIVGGLVAKGEGNEAQIQDNTITLGTADSISKRFGGLLGEDSKKLVFENNSISGEVKFNDNSSDESVSGGLVSIPKTSVFTGNKISLKLTDLSTSENSSVGGYFGRVDSAYSVSEVKEENGVQYYTNSNTLTADAVFQGVHNVGLQVGRMKDWTRSALDTTSSNVKATAIGFEYVGGMVGRVIGHVDKFDNLTSAGTIKSVKYDTGAPAPQYFGGLFGGINDRGTGTKVLQLESLTNNCDIDVFDTDSYANLVGGIIGKLGAVPKYNINKDYDYKVHSEVVFGNGEGEYNTQQYSIVNCATNAKTIKGRYYVGGIIGSLATQGKNLVLNNLTSEGTVYGLGGVGGILGLSYTPGNNEDSLQITTLKNGANLEIWDKRSGGDYFGGITGTIFSTNRMLYTTVVADGDGNIVKEESLCDFKELENTGNISGGKYTGGLFGKIVSTSGSITGFKNILVEGEISGKDYVGGIMGEYTIDPNLPAETVFTISGITSTGTRTGQNYVGGLFGRLDLTGYLVKDGVLEKEGGKAKETALKEKVYAKITDITNSAHISSSAKVDNYAGGIIGELDAHSTVVDITPDTGKTISLTNTGAISGGGYVGGLFGNVILNNKVSVKKTIQDAAGNTGEIDYHSIITDLTNSGAVNGGESTYIGGIIGYLNYTGNEAVAYSVYNLVNEGAIDAGKASNVGGIFGSVKNYNIYGISENQINGVYTRQVFKNTAQVSGNTNVGGIIGFTDNDVSNLNGKLAGSTSTTMNSAFIVNSELNGTRNVMKASASDTSNIGLNILNTGTVIGSGSNVGGYVGRLAKDENAGGTTTARVEYLINNASVGGSATNVGGVVGDYYYPKQSYLMSITFNGSVVGTSSVGGLIGNLHFDKDGSASNAPKFMKQLTYVVADNISGYGSKVGGMFGEVTVTNPSNEIARVFDFNFGLNQNTTLYPDCVGVVDVESIRGIDNVGGLMGLADRVTIQSVGIEFERISGTGNNVGGYVGSMSYGFLNYAYANILKGVDDAYAPITGGGSKVGGLIGYAHHAEPGGVYMKNIAVSGNSDVGGFIGYALGIESGPSVSTLDISYKTQLVNVTVNGGKNVGGLLGYSQFVDIVKDSSGISYNDALRLHIDSVVGTENVGGLLGYSENTYISSSPNGIRITVDKLNGNKNVGGYIGYLKTPRNNILSMSAFLGSGSYHIKEYTGTRDYTVGNAIGVLDCAGMSDQNIYKLSEAVFENNAVMSPYTIGTIYDTIKIGGGDFSKVEMFTTYNNQTPLDISIVNSSYTYGKLISNGGVYTGKVMHISDSDDGIVKQNKEREVITLSQLEYEKVYKGEGQATCTAITGNTHPYNIYEYVPQYGEGTIPDGDNPQGLDRDSQSHSHPLASDVQNYVRPACELNEKTGQCTFTGELNKYTRNAVTIKTLFVHSDVGVWDQVENNLPITNNDFDALIITVFNELTEHVKFVFNDGNVSV